MTEKEILQAKVLEELNRLLATDEEFHGVESDLVDQFLTNISLGHMEDRIPLAKEDTIIREMSFKFGRADLVIFHIDGSASVIEVKDGAKGYSHVVAGIGQAGLYAAQLGMGRTFTYVRRCLMWSSPGNLIADALIEDVCKEAGVIPLPWQSMRSIIACMQATKNVILGAKEKEGQEVGKDISDE